MEARSEPSQNTISHPLLRELFKDTTPEGCLSHPRFRPYFSPSNYLDESVTTRASRDTGGGGLWRDYRLM